VFVLYAVEVMAQLRLARRIDWAVVRLSISIDLLSNSRDGNAQREMLVGEVFE
jgi:hypothetical protein